jgi:hypothetical protein
MPPLPIKTSEDSARIASKARGSLFEQERMFRIRVREHPDHFSAAIGIIGSLRTGRTGATLGSQPLARCHGENRRGALRRKCANLPHKLQMGRNVLQVAHGVVRKDLAMAICFQGVSSICKIGDQPTGGSDVDSEMKGPEPNAAAF